MHSDENHSSSFFLPRCSFLSYYRNLRLWISHCQVGDTALFIYLFVAFIAMEAVAIPHRLDSGIGERIRQEKEGDDWL